MAPLVFNKWGITMLGQRLINVWRAELYQLIAHYRIQIAHYRMSSEWVLLVSIIFYSDWNYIDAKNKTRNNTCHEGLLISMRRETPTNQAAMSTCSDSDFLMRGCSWKSKITNLDWDEFEYPEIENICYSKMLTHTHMLRTVWIMYNNVCSIKISYNP